MVKGTGTVELVAGPALAVRMDRTKKLHKWYVADELRRTGAGRATNVAIIDELLILGVAGGALAAKDSMPSWSKLMGRKVTGL